MTVVIVGPKGVPEVVPAFVGFLQTLGLDQLGTWLAVEARVMRVARLGRTAAGILEGRLKGLELTMPPRPIGGSV